MEANIKVTGNHYHRNGVGGPGFYVLEFTDVSEGRDLLGIVTDSNQRHENVDTPDEHTYQLVLIDVIDPTDLEAGLRGHDYYGQALVDYLNEEYQRKYEDSHWTFEKDVI